MFDTVRLSVKEPLPSPSALYALGFKMPYDGAGKRWYLNKGALKFSWIRTQSNDLLSVETSLPKFLNGNNVELITSDEEMERALDSLSIIASDKTNVAFDARVSDVVRLDACWHWYMEQDEVYSRIHALRNAHVARMKRRPYDHGTYLATKSETLLAYSKHSEVLERANKGEATNEELRLSAGIFRLERRFKGRDKCAREAANLGLPNQSAGALLCADVAEKVLNEGFMDLKLNSHIESSDSRFALLREKYGLTPTYFRLKGFLQTCDEEGADNLIKQGVNPETFRRNRKAIEEAGAWITHPSRRTLPPLREVRIKGASSGMSINVQRSHKIVAL